MKLQVTGMYMAVGFSFILTLVLYSRISAYLFLLFFCSLQVRLAQQKSVTMTLAVLCAQKKPSVQRRPIVGRWLPPLNIVVIFPTVVLIHLVRREPCRRTAVVISHKIRCLWVRFASPIWPIWFQNRYDSKKTST